MEKGLFVTFEGGEGSGKSTQSSLLYKFLKENDFSAVKTREPGGTPEAEEIRALLVTGDPEKWHKKTELLLMNAARCEHLHRLIIPALERGQDVVCDRFVDSSLAYQGYGRDINLENILFFHTFIGGTYPDVTFFIDIPESVGLKRTKLRKINVDERFEKESLHFHQKVREGYIALSKKI